MESSEKVFVVGTWNPVSGQINRFEVKADKLSIDGKSYMFMVGAEIVASFPIRITLCVFERSRVKTSLIAA